MMLRQRQGVSRHSPIDRIGLKQQKSCARQNIAVPLKIINRGRFDRRVAFRRQDGDILGIVAIFDARRKFAPPGRNRHFLRAGQPIGSCQIILPLGLLMPGFCILLRKRTRNAAIAAVKKRVASGIVGFIVGRHEFGLRDIGNIRRKNGGGGAVKYAFPARRRMVLRRLGINRDDRPGEFLLQRLLLAERHRQIADICLPDARFSGCRRRQIGINRRAPKHQTRPQNRRHASQFNVQHLTSPHLARCANRPNPAASLIRRICADRQV